jgi:Tfp pilus assembly protein PilO
MAKLVLAIIMFIAAGATVIGYVSPTYTAALKVKETVATYDQALQKATEVQNLKRGLLAKLNEFSGANVERLEKLLPDHIDNVHLVLDLDGMATQRGLTLSSVEVHREGAAGGEKKAGSVSLAGAIEKQQKYQSVVLTFSVVSTYADFNTFIRDLDALLISYHSVLVRDQPVVNSKQQTPHVFLMNFLNLLDSVVSSVGKLRQFRPIQHTVSVLVFVPTGSHNLIEPVWK